MNHDFRKYAVHHLGMNGLALDQYTSQVTDSFISPTIIEERKLNVAQMDVFSRLMMDRIIFLGTQVDDYTANVIQAQLLYLDSCDPGKDVSIYINSPGGSVYAGLGIYDTMQYIQSDVSTICTGMAASMAAVILACGEPGCRQGWSSRLSLQALRPSSMARREQERRRRFISWPKPAEGM